MCECGRVTECPTCWRRADAARRAGQPKQPNKEPPAPCAHLGDELTGRERAARGLDHARRWALCLHDEKPLGEVVCPCRGCNSSCPGYAAP